MGPYPLNMVRQLSGEEPIEVSVVGTTAADSTLGTPETVSVCFRFSESAWRNSPLANYHVTQTEHGWALRKQGAEMSVENGHYERLKS